MSRFGTAHGDVRIFGVRRQSVPVVSTLAASLLDLLPIVSTTPLVPDFAYLVLLAWRLVRGDIHLMLNTAYEPEHRPPKPDPRVPARGDAVAAFQQPAAFETNTARRRVVNAGRYTASFNVLSLGVVYHF